MRTCLSLARTTAHGPIFNDRTSLYGFVGFSL